MTSSLPLALAIALVTSSAITGGIQPEGTPCPTPCPAPVPGPDPLASYRDEKAAKLFVLIESNPGQPEVRRKLASHFNELGPYARVSEFFSLTADYLEKKPIDWVRHSPLASSLPCNMFEAGSDSAAVEQAKQIAAVALSVGREVRRDEFFAGSGLAAAEDALRDHGPYCALLAEWSHAFTWYAMAHPGQSAATSRELSVRLLVALGEQDVSPGGYEGRASVYFLLAENFSLHRDYVSAYVAVLIAKDHVAAGSATGSENKESFRRRLDKEIAKLAKLAKGQRAGKR